MFRSYLSDGIFYFCECSLKWDKHYFFWLHFLSFNSGFFPLARLHISSCCRRVWVRGGEREISIQFLSAIYIKFLGFPTRSMHTKGKRKTESQHTTIWMRGQEWNTFGHITFSNITFNLDNDKGERFNKMSLKEHEKKQKTVETPMH